MDNILELLVIDITVSRPNNCNRIVDSFCIYRFFFLSKADLSSLNVVELARNLLITWSLSPNDNRPVLDGSLLLFRRLWKKKGKSVFILHKKPLQEFYLFWHKGLIDEPSFSFINFRTVKLVRFLDPRKNITRCLKGWPIQLILIRSNKPIYPN